MADRLMIERLVEGGMTAADAEAAVDAVFGAVAAVLADSKSVLIPGVGRLAAPQKQRWVPSRPTLQHYYRKVVLKTPATLWTSEAWEPIKW